MIDLLLKSLPEPWPNCYFCFHMSMSFQSLILEPGFCDSEEAWQTVVFYKQETDRGHGRKGVPGRPHRVLLSSKSSDDIVQAQWE